MQERDKLATVLDKLNEDQARILMRLAEALIEENREDPMRDSDDVRARYAQFKRWCETNSLDLSSVEVWIRESRASAIKVTG